ncbi:hypothetical protein PSAB6_620025 [Paraburkholderia sabiae]|nr:hypothetical protein PSAB6_620025 [Paraburkholderia sabiae]
MLAFAGYFHGSLSLASAWRLGGAGVAPVRGGTYFSLQRQRKVGKRKPLTPPILVFFQRITSVPTLHTTPRNTISVAIAPIQRPTNFMHRRRSPQYGKSTTAIGRTICRDSRSQRKPTAEIGRSPCRDANGATTYTPFATWAAVDVW